MKLTTASGVELPKGKNDMIVFDDELRGFGLRVRRRPGDRIIKSWIIQKRMKGRMRRMLLGNAATLTAAQARARANKLLAKITLGDDPQGDKVEQRRKDALLVRAVVNDFVALKRGELRKNSVLSLIKYLQPTEQDEEGEPTKPRKKRTRRAVYLKPLHTTSIAQVTRADIAARVLAVSKASGARTALGFRAAVASMLTWAMQMGYIEQNPMIGVFKPKPPEARTRVLTGEELAAIWRACGDDDHGKIVKLILLTACRAEEIGGMRWSEGLDEDTWTLPASRSKNRQQHSLPITDLMREVLDTVPVREGNDHLFGRKGFTLWSTAKAALDEKLGWPEGKEWQLRDLRRTVSTRMNEDLEVPPWIVEQILNHQGGHRGGVAGVYNKASYWKQVVQAMALWSDHIRSIVEGGEAQDCRVRAARGRDVKFHAQP
jgi:integrase